MFKGFFGTLLGKFGVVALLVAGVATGLAVTGAMPGSGPQSVMVASAAPGGPVMPAAGVTLDFPTQVLPVRGVPVEPVIEVVEEIVVVTAPAPAPAPAPAAAAAPVAPPACVAVVDSTLNQVVGAIPAVVSAEQGLALLEVTTVLTDVAQACVHEALSIGYAGVDAVVHLADQVVATVAQLQALPLLNTPVTAGPGQTPDPLGDLIGGTLGRVDRGLGLLGGLLGMFGGAGR